jgi:hypothetical protein
MRDRLIELIEEADKKCNDTKQCENCVGFGHGGECVNHLIADHLLANGVIVPPCKVGDKVWFLNIYNSIAMRRNAVYEAKVARVYIENGNILCLAIQIKNEWGNTEFPRITEIGKTVFLTKEEAEKALAER